MLAASGAGNGLRQQPRRRGRVRFQQQASTSYRGRRRCCSVAKQQQSFTSGSHTGSRDSTEKLGLGGHLFVDIGWTGNGICRRRGQHDVVAAELRQCGRSFLVASVDDVHLEADRPVLSDDPVQDVDGVGCRRVADSSSRNDVPEFRLDFRRRRRRRCRVRRAVVFLVAELAAVVWNDN